MTSRDFRLIASLLANRNAPLSEIESVANLISHTNYRFDFDRFISAALGTPRSPGDRPRKGDYR